MASRAVDVERDALRKAFDEIMARDLDRSFVDEAYGLLAAHLRRDRRKDRAA